MNISSIYKIQSIIKPERCYIGSAIDVKNRWGQHRHGLRQNKHYSTKLQRHYNKYGEFDLMFSIIEPCLPEFLTIREDTYLHPLPYFNTCKIAGSQLGFKHSDETKEIIRESSKGNINKKGSHLSEETKILLREAKKKQISPWPKGSHHSEETKKYWSEIRKGRASPRKGVHLSQEIRDKIGKSRKGKKDSDEVRKKKKESRLAYFAKKRLENNNKNCA